MQRAADLPQSTRRSPKVKLGGLSPLLRAAQGVAVRTRPSAQGCSGPQPASAALRQSVCPLHGVMIYMCECGESLSGSYTRTQRVLGCQPSALRTYRKCTSLPNRRASSDNLARRGPRGWREQVGGCALVSVRPPARLRILRQHAGRLARRLVRRARVDAAPAPPAQAPGESA